MAGYIHRDIKPSNFAVSRSMESHQLHIFDFGIARQHLDRGEVRCARNWLMRTNPKRRETSQTEFRREQEHVRFLGTLQYATRRCHMEKDQGRCDDVEAWLYMAVDLFDHACLPWGRMRKREDVLKAKVVFFGGVTPDSRPDPNGCKGTAQLSIGLTERVPAQFAQIARRLARFQYADPPPYSAVQHWLTRLCFEAHANMGAPWDWVVPKTAHTAEPGAFDAAAKTLRPPTCSRDPKPTKSMKPTPHCLT